MSSVTSSYSILHAARRAAHGVLLPALLGVSAFACADDWPQFRGPRRDGVYRETGIVEKLPPELKIKWRVAIGDGYSGPAVVKDRLYVLDRVSKDAAVAIDGRYKRVRQGGTERVLCVDATNGKILWQHEYPSRYEMGYPSGPRATPTVDGDKVYTVGAMGHLFCFDSQTGKVLWAREYVRDYGLEMNSWGMASAPLVDGKKVILLVGGQPEACVVALDKNTGKELWRALQSEDPGYASPLIVEAGGKRQLIALARSFLAGLNPETGEVYWKEERDVREGITLASPVFEPASNRLLVTFFHAGSWLLELERETPSARVLWRGKSRSEIKTDGLHGLMCTPTLHKGYIYGVCSYGQLRCLDADTGERVWETYEATGHARWWNAFLIRHEDRFFICNDEGDLIFAELSSKGYEEKSRVKLIEPTNPVRRRKVVWSLPAFANRCVYARNDGTLLCAHLAAAEYES